MYPLNIERESRILAMQKYIDINLTKKTDVGSIRYWTFATLFFLSRCILDPLKLNSSHFFLQKKRAMHC